MEGLEKVIIGDLEMQRRTGRSSVVSNHAPYHHGRFSDVFKCVRILVDVHMYVCSLAEDALRVQLSLCCKRLGSSSGLDSVNVTMLVKYKSILELIFTY